MTDLKRFPVKYIRDYLKKHYLIKTNCYICDKTTDLETHHLYSISDLFNQWLDKQQIKEINSVEEIMRARVVFAEQYAKELAPENHYTLCKSHHTALHSLFGQNYDLYLVEKVKKWIEVKRNGAMDVPSTRVSSDKA